MSAIELKDGVNFEAEQTWREGWRLNRGGRWVQVRIRNMKGRLGIRRITVEGVRGKERNGVVAS